MRENRTCGSEGGGTELNQSFLPLCAPAKAFEQQGASPCQAKRYRPVSEGNCVSSRKGGEQPEVNDQSEIK